MPQKEVKTIIFKVTLDNSEAKKQADDLRKDLKAKLKDMEGDFSGLKSAAGAVFSGIADVGISAFKLIGNAAEGVKDAFVSVAKESISLEDAMNGVKRTGGLTTDQIAQLTNKVRDYSVETLKGFVSSEDLAKALEIAGQAGIISGDNFEKSADTALKFAGVLTQAAVALDGMSLEESGEKLGRFHLTFSETVDDIDKAASVLNYFGNITTRSAGFILNLSGRFAENAKVLRLSEGETMALAAALGNLNMESEQSGTAMSRAMKVMRSESAAFAEAFQMDVGKFSSLIKTDASAAIQMFADQMAKLGQTNEGVDIVLQALSDLEMTGQGVSTALLGLGGQADNLRQYLADQGREWTNNTSLMNEFINSTDRTSQLWTALQNIWTNTTGLMGDQLLPVFRSFLTNVNEQAAAFRIWFKESGFVETVLAPALTEINALLLSGVKYVSEFVAGWAKTVDIDAVMASLKEKFFALIKDIKDVDWSGLFTGLTRNLEELWTYFRSEEFSTFATRLKTDLTAAFTYLTENLPTVTEAFKMFFSILEKVVQAGENFSKWMQIFGKIESVSAAKFEEWGSTVSGVFTKAEDALQPLDDAVAQIGWEIVEAGKETTLWVSGASQGMNELTKGVENYIEAVKKAEHETTGASQGTNELTKGVENYIEAVKKAEHETTGAWLPDMVSWTDKARQDVAGLTSAISQSASAAAQASAQISAQAQTALAALDAQGAYIQSLKGDISQGARDVFDARQRIAQKLLPAGQVLFEDGSIGTTAQVQAAQSVQTAASAASSKYGSGIQQIAPGVWSNIAREVDKANAKIAIVGTTLTNVKSEMDSVANTAYKQSLFPELVKWSDKAAKGISGIATQTRSVTTAMDNADRLAGDYQLQPKGISTGGMATETTQPGTRGVTRQSPPAVVVNYNGMNMIDESSQRRMVSQISNAQKSANTRTVTTR